jgi:Fe-Mn family superoxide dismutase
MKVSIKYENPDLKEHKDLVSEFIKLLQEEYPLKKDLKIIFMDGRKGDMSTGSRRGDNLIKVLAKGRLNRDIMRTLGHEWVHEYQMTILGREPGPNIGGRNEDEANAFAGQLVKKFEENHPDLEKLMYENKGIEGRVSILSEQILLTEKETIKENLLVEMKKVGIEKLPYSYSALQRFIDSKTMNVHYNKHYKGYVDKLNKAIKDKEGDMDLEEIVKSISKFDDKVRNNAGGSFNHALFWKMLSPKKQLPKGEILKKIKEDFGNIKKMKDEFNQAAQDRFGSGWAWLYLAKDGKLKIMSTPNQDNPLMNIVKGGGYPLLGLDVWEHAYYLKYQNKRDEYIKKFWDVVNWEFVEELYTSKNKKKNLKENVEDNDIISEARKKSSFPLTPTQVRKLINGQYEGCFNQQFKYGCVGKIQKRKCKTDIGVLGGDFAERKYGGTSQWSIINRFDTNSLVHSEIQKIWMEETEGLEDFATWINSHAYDLFSNDGMYTERLVNLNKSTIESGHLNEDYAKKIIRENYKLKPEDEGITYELYEHCSGDINDRKKGQDIVLKYKNGETIYFQVKPVESDKIMLYDGGERGYYFVVPSWVKSTKYKSENVDVFVFVDRPQQKYLMFRNDPSRILTIDNPKYTSTFLIYFYELPLSSNFKVDVTSEPVRTPIKKTLERDKQKEIQYYKDRIKYFKNKIKELSGSEVMSEMVKYYEKKLEKIII